MTPLNQPNGAAICDLDTVHEAFSAALDGNVRRFTDKSTGESFDGWVWELYRSINTKSLRIRVSDLQKYVHHYNSFDLLIEAAND